MNDSPRAAALLAASLAAFVPAGMARGAEDRLASEVRAFFERHCVACHRGVDAEAGLRLDELRVDSDQPSSASRWREVMGRVGSGDMPPADVEVRPSVEATARLVEWIASRLDEADRARLPSDRFALHRLSREEVAHTVRDLLGVDVDVSRLVADDEWRGLRRVGSAMSVSPAHVERYLEVSAEALDLAYPVATRESRVTRLTARELIGGERADEVDPRSRVDLWPGQSIDVAAFASATPGRYVLRVKASGLRSTDGRPPHLSIEAPSLDRWLGGADVVAEEGGPVTIELDVHLPVPERLRITNEVSGPAILARLERSLSRPFVRLVDGPVPWQVAVVGDDGEPLLPLLLVDWIEWEGPPSDGADDLRRSYLPLDATATAIRDALVTFTRRAWRRPVAQDEVAPFVDLVVAQLGAGRAMTAAMKSGMLAVMSSAGFLYLVEGDPDGVRREADGWEVASRMSYLLWLTMPDASLLDAARAGDLADADVRTAHAARMLADARTSRFAESFATQWLRLDQVGRFAPDAELYPDYETNLERSMVRESVAYLEEALRGNAPIVELLDSDWTMLNERLALHYGIDGVTGDAFRRVPLASRRRRGGLLTHASVLSSTSDGVRHRPVHRGAWILENVLGRVPPPPPPEVEPLAAEPPEAAQTTVRARLAAHQSRPSCASCHREIDPLGLAFEHYDAIGRWRESAPGRWGEEMAIDASGTLADGRSFSGALELRRLLADDVDRFRRALLERLAAYGLRRPMVASDDASLDAIAADAVRRGDGLADLVTSLVRSELFATIGPAEATPRRKP